MKKMKTIFNWIGDDWRRVKNHCRTTDNKDFTEKDATDIFKKKLLISEHSPIRLLEFDWTWKAIKYWLSTEMSRHKYEKFISTARDDRGFSERKTEEGYTVWDEATKQNIEYHPLSRDDAPQKNPVNFDGYANMQNLIDVWRKRLCFCCTKDARELAEDFKYVLHETHPIEADVLQKNCIYRCGCPEFKSCGYWENFCKKYSKEDLTNIQTRYDLANKEFYENYKKKDKSC